MKRQIIIEVDEPGIDELEWETDPSKLFQVTRAFDDLKELGVTMDMIYYKGRMRQGIKRHSDRENDWYQM